MTKPQSIPFLYTYNLTNTTFGDVDVSIVLRVKRSIKALKHSLVSREPDSNPVHRARRPAKEYGFAVHTCFAAPRVLGFDSESEAYAHAIDFVLSGAYRGRDYFRWQDIKVKFESDPLNPLNLTIKGTPQWRTAVTCSISHAVLNGIGSRARRLHQLLSTYNVPCTSTHGARGQFQENWLCIPLDGCLDRGDF